MSTAWQVDYGPAHNLQPLMKALLRMPGMRTQITETLAHLDQNEEIDHCVVDLLLPQIAPDLSPEARNRGFEELKFWLVSASNADVQLGQPADMSASQWQEECRRRIDEVLHQLAGVK